MPTGVSSRVVAHDRLVVIVRPDHPWVRRRRAVSRRRAQRDGVDQPGGGVRHQGRACGRAAPGIRRGTGQVAPVMALSTTSAVRAAVLAGAGPAVLSELAVIDDLATGRLVEISVDGMDLRRTLRAIWVGPRTPPAGAARDLLSHILAQRHQ